MLQKLNERIQGVVAWLVIILIAVTFTLFGIDYYMQSHQDSNAQVEVNGQAITKQAFEVSYRRTRQLRDPAQMTATSENQLKKQVMDEMILNRVSVQAARTYGFEVNIAQADAAILSIPQFQEDGHFSSDRYQQALTGAFFTPESFQTEVRQGMLLNQQRFAFMGTAFALPTEIERFVKLYMQTRDYSYLSIPSALFIKQVVVNDDEINNYYQQHQKEFVSPEKISIDYIHLSMKDIKEKIKLSDEQIQTYYNDNQSNYFTPAQWQVAHILFALPADASAEEQERVHENADNAFKMLQKDPALFDEKMATLSDDKISNINKGVLPWIVAGQTEFDKALVKLDNPGQISEPVKSSHGYEIFKLISYKPATVKPLAEVKGDIEDQVIVEQAQAEYARALEQLSDLSYQTPDSLTPVAEALKLDVKQSAPFSREGDDNPLTKNKQVINAAFSHDVLELGNNSEPVQVDNDGVVVLRINKRIPSAQKSLAEVKTGITDKIAKKKAEDQAQQLGEQLLNAKQDSTQLQKLITANQLQWHDVTQAARDDSESAPESINELAFNLAKAGAKTGHSLNNGDYVLVELKKINDGQLATLDNEQRASITQQIEASSGLMDYDLYINDLVSKAKIVNH